MRTLRTGPKRMVWLRKYIRLLPLFILIGMTAVLSAKTAAAASDFPDIRGHWAETDIRTAVKSGYVSGFPDGTFKPERKVSRAEFIRMLADALKLPHVEKGNPWYQPYVASLIEFGFHKNNDFKDYNKSLSRLEMIRMAARASNPDLTTDGVQDKTFVVWAAENGLLYGASADGDLNLDGSVTRAEAVVIIERVLMLNKGGKLDVNQDAVDAANDL